MKRQMKYKAFGIGAFVFLCLVIARTFLVDLERDEVESIMKKEITERMGKEVSIETVDKLLFNEETQSGSMMVLYTVKGDSILYADQYWWENGEPVHKSTEEVSNLKP